MNNEQLLLTPEDRALVETISQQVLANVAPSESEETADFIGEFVDMAAKDQIKVVSSPDRETGGFGSEDLIVAVVVPVIVGVVKDILVELGKTKISELQETLALQKQQEVARLVKVHTGRVTEYYIARSRSARARTKAKEIKESVTSNLMRLFKHGS